MLVLSCSHMIFFWSKSLYVKVWQSFFSSLTAYTWQFFRLSHISLHFLKTCRLNCLVHAGFFDDVAFGWPLIPVEYVHLERFYFELNFISVPNLKTFTVFAQIRTSIFRSWPYTAKNNTIILFKILIEYFFSFKKKSSSEMLY